MKTTNRQTARSLRNAIYQHFNVQGPRQLRKLHKFTAQYDLRRRDHLKQLWEQCQTAADDLNGWWQTMYSFNQNPAFSLEAA